MRREEGRELKICRYPCLFGSDRRNVQKAAHLGFVMSVVRDDIVELYLR